MWQVMCPWVKCATQSVQHAVMLQRQVYLCCRSTWVNTKVCAIQGTLCGWAPVGFDCREPEWPMTLLATKVSMVWCPPTSLRAKVTGVSSKKLETGGEVTVVGSCHSWGMFTVGKRLQRLRRYSAGSADDFMCHAWTIVETMVQCGSIPDALYHRQSSVLIQYCNVILACVSYCSSGTSVHSLNTQEASCV